MRALVAVAILLTLGGCAPDAAAGTQRVEVEGVITRVMAAGEGNGYVLEMMPFGVLSLDVGDQLPPLMATGVVVEVPDSLVVPAQSEGQFEALNGLVEATGEGLAVVAFLP